MKRKVIQHSPTSLVITLPKEWIDRYNICKGLELDVFEKDSQLCISKGEIEKTTLETEIDITDLDRTTIMLALRNLYRAGYDKITIKFEKNQFVHHKSKNPIHIIEIIHERLQTLMGYEITRETKGSCIVENISEGLSEELPRVVQRVYLLLIDICESIYDATMKKDHSNLKIIDKKLETVVRFINYCLRTSNKEQRGPNSLSQFKFHVLATVDRIVYLLRSSAKWLFRTSTKIDKSTIRVIELTLDSLRLLNQIAYKKNSRLMVEINNNRYEIESIIAKGMHKYSENEDIVIRNMVQIHHLLTDIANVKGH